MLERIENIMLLVLLSGLAACSSNDDNEPFAPYAGSNKLKPVVDASEFEKSYKTSLINYYENQQFSVYYTDDLSESDEVDGSSPTDSSSSESSANSVVTSTNLQEAGVDEADRIKTDGESLFLLEAKTYNYYPNNSAESTSAPYNPAPGDEGNKVNIYQLNPDALDLELLSEVDLGLADNMLAEGLFLYEDDGAKSLVVTATSGWGNYGWYDSYAWSAGATAISLMDVQDPAESKVTKTISVEGSMISSRRIGSHLLVASRFHPNLENIHYYPHSDEEKALNRTVINGLSLDGLLPKVTDQNGKSAPLATASDCFVADVESSSVPAVDVISLYSVDLDDLSVVSSLCYVGASEAFYASTEAVYLATTRYQWTMQQADVVDYQGSTVETDIHQFAFDNGVLSYQASGSVDGHLGWNAKQRPFRLSAKNGDLRVVSYTAELDVSKSPVKFSILRQSGSELSLLAVIPNSRHPEPLGKPGETLYASRFVGDKAYFVTFRMTDPLYILDLSEPENPKRIGELFVEGYSDYLHPVGENLLLGIGKDAIADQSGGDGRGAWYQGVKLSLIDVEDPANPLEVDRLVFGQRGSESTALYDHHAFTYLSAAQTGMTGRLAFPLKLNADISPQNTSTPWEWHDWQSSGLQLVAVDETTKALSVQGFIETASSGEQQYAPGFYNDRAVLLNDTVYFVQENSVYASGWQSQEFVNGPR